MRASQVIQSVSSFQESHGLKTILVWTPNGVEITKLKVNTTVDTVNDICLRLNKVTQIPVQRLKLVCKGSKLPLDDSRTLAEHGVKDGSKLHMVNVGRVLELASLQL